MPKEFHLALAFVISFVLSRTVYKLAHLGFVVQYGAFWGVLVRLALWGLLFALCYFLFRFFSSPKESSGTGETPSPKDSTPTAPD